MLLVDIVKELKKKTRQLRDFGNRGIISYDLQGKIIYDSEGKKRNLCFEGNLMYRTNFESYPPKTKKRRALNAGNISSAPNKSETSKGKFIVSLAREMTQERYGVSYDSKKNIIRIQATGDLEKELRRIKKISGSPIRQEFKI